VRCELPDDIDVGKYGYESFVFNRWMKSKGMDPDKPYSSMCNNSNFSTIIHQDDEYTFKWIGDEYE
jgi:hypothetical protein